ncbi:MAG: phosphorylase family protein [Acidiferrobacter sp.]
MRRCPALGMVGTLPGGDRLVIGGMGAAASTRAAAALEAAGAQGLVSWGTCGGLAPTLSPGTVIIADRVIDEDGRCYRADDMLRRWAWQGSAGLAVHSGSLISVAQVVATVAAKRALFVRTGACAVDMESAAVARYAACRGLPFVAIRTVVDPAQTPLPAAVLTALDRHGRVRLGRLAWSIIARWQTLGELVGLARHFRCAERSLATLAPRLLDVHPAVLTDFNSRQDCADEGHDRY